MHHPVLHPPAARSWRGTLLGTTLFVATLLLTPGIASAHCDTLDGPVVSAAREALATENANLILVWVRPEAEAQIRARFAETLAARAVGGDAADAADTAFFSDLVRIHREGEGAVFDGLKPAGAVEPAVAALDRSLAEESPTELVTLLTGNLTPMLEEHVETLLAKRQYDPNDVDAGREYVEAYVAFAHKVEALDAAIAAAPTHDTAPAAAHAAHAAVDAAAPVHDAHTSSEHASHLGDWASSPTLPWVLAALSLLANGVLLFTRKHQ